MVRKLFELAQFFIERPPLTGVLVAGMLYAIQRRNRGRRRLSEPEKERVLQLYREQRTYAETMYEPPREGEESAVSPARPKQH